MGEGTLVLVGTPIGNLGDLSPRAVEALAAADVIACEDTRRTRKLLTYAGVPAPHLVAVHDHNEAAQVRRLLARLDAGERVAMVSDAGMPGIADPGERLVRAATGAGHRVEVVPGPSAAVAALVVSGLPAGRFCFEGFLPRKGSGREERVRAVAALVVSGLPAGRFCFEGFLPRKGSGRDERLRAVAAERRTTVLYEAPHRVRRTVADLLEACGADRPVTIVRELTKAFEETWRGTLAAAARRLDETEPRGEHVLVLGGAGPPEAATEDDVELALRRHLDAGGTKRDAAASVAAELGIPKRRAYEIATRLG